jgi:hypothetical protein
MATTCGSRFRSESADHACGLVSKVCCDGSAHWASANEFSGANEQTRERAKVTKPYRFEADVGEATLTKPLCSPRERFTSTLARH